MEESISTALFYQIKQPILLFGKTATSKTATMLNYLNNLNANSFVSHSTSLQEYEDVQYRLTIAEHPQNSIFIENVFAGCSTCHRIGD